MSVIAAMGNRHSAIAIPFQPYQARHAYAKLLLDEGRHYREISRLTGTSPNTLTRIKRGELIPDSRITEALQKHEAAKLTTLFHGILDAVTGDDIAAASLQQKVTSAAILVDKRELIEGRPTQIMGYGSMAQSAHEVQRRLAELRREAEVLTQGTDGVYTTSQAVNPPAPSLQVVPPLDQSVRSSTVEE